MTQTQCVLLKPLLSNLIFVYSLLFHICDTLESSPCIHIREKASSPGVTEDGRGKHTSLFTRAFSVKLFYCRAKLQCMLHAQFGIWPRP